LSDANENITALQDNITTLSNDISNLLSKNEVLLMEADLREPHILHLESPFLDLDCADCHDVDNSGAVIIREDYYYDDTELIGHTFRRDVNVAECAECHGPFPDIMPEDNMNVTWLEENDESCISGNCHDDWKTDRMDEVTHVDLDYIESQVTVTGVDTETIVETCLNCHGGQQWYMEGP
jgi:cytochrome c553